MPRKNQFRKPNIPRDGHSKEFDSWYMRFVLFLFIITRIILKSASADTL